MRKNRLLSLPFLCLYVAAILAIILDRTRGRWGSMAWFGIATGAAAAMALISLLEIGGQWISLRRSGMVRGEGWAPQITKADQRIRKHRQFPAFASLLAARGVDLAQTIFMDGNFVDGGGKGDYLLILPSGNWAQCRWRGDSIPDWVEDVRDDYSDDFQAEADIGISRSDVNPS